MLYRDPAVGDYIAVSRDLKTGENGDLIVGQCVRAPTPEEEAAAEDPFEVEFTFLNLLTDAPSTKKRKVFFDRNAFVTKEQAEEIAAAGKGSLKGAKAARAVALEIRSRWEVPPGFPPGVISHHFILLDKENNTNLENTKILAKQVKDLKKAAEELVKAL